MAFTRGIETQTGWSVRKFVRSAHSFPNVKVKAGNQILIAAGPLPTDHRCDRCDSLRRCGEVTSRHVRYSEGVIPCPHAVVIGTFRSR